MSSISFTAHGRCARATVCEPITTGSVGLSVSFAFDAAWNGLQKTAIFRGSGMAVDLVLSGDAATVPPEVLTIPGGDLRVGVWGADPDGNVIIPTVWATVGEIVPGAAPSGFDPQPPTPSWAAQVQEIAQDALDTANSVREDADAGEFDGATYTPAVSAGGDLSWTNDKDKPNPPTVNIKGPEGQPGQTGATPDLSIGTVETLPPGSPATAAITGTAENPVLSFGIPQGQQGAPGEVTQAEFDELADEVAQQKSAIMDANKGIENFSLYAPFDHYGLTANGTYLVSQKYRVSCVTHVKFDRDITVNVASGFRWGYIPFTEGTVGAWSGWFTSSTIIPSGLEFVVQIARSPTEITTEIADVNEFVSAITFSTKLAETVNAEFFPEMQKSLLVDTGAFVRGSINGSGVDVNSGTYNGNTIRTTYIDIAGNTKVQIVLPDGWKFGWHFYNTSGTHISSASGFILSSIILSVPSNAAYLRLNLRKKTNADITDEEISAIVVPMFGSKGIYTTLYNASSPSVDLSVLGWEAGSINSSGDPDITPNRIRSGYLDISIASVLVFNPLQPVAIGFHIYDENFAQIYAPSSYLYGATSYNVPSNAKYLKINLAPISGTIELTDYTKLSVRAVINYAKLMNSEIGANGTYVAKGEKISFALDSTWKYGASTYIDFNSTDYESLSDYGLSGNQSMAIFGNYIFLLQDGGYIVAVDYTTKEFVGSVFRSEITTRNHHNSAQFSDYYYDADDDFPLLFVARCGNTASAGSEDTCLVYRIQVEDGEFSVTLINTIETDLTTYGTSWSIDVNERTITQVGYANDIWSVTTNNPIYAWKWQLPSKASIISGNTISLKVADCVETAVLPYVMLQASHSYGGKVYIADNNEVSVIDLARSMYTTKLALPSLSREVEGIEIYNGKIYVSMRENDATNPLVILELSV